MLAPGRLYPAEDPHAAGSLRLRALAALAVVLGLALPAAGARAATVDLPKPPATIAGVAAHPWRLEARSPFPYVSFPNTLVRERSFAAIQAARVRYVRVDLKWSDVEPYPGMVIRDWSDFDTMVGAASAHGLRLLPMVAYTPIWASSTGHWFGWPRDSDLGRFEDFMAEAFRRYPQIKAWEIWNEPNLRFFAKPAPDAARFTGLLRAAYRARARVGSRARLVSGGLAAGGDIPTTEFMDQMAALRAFDYVDGFGIHPYSPLDPEDPRSFFERLPALRRKLVELGAGRLGVWITEYGRPSAPVKSIYGPPSDESIQADWLRRAYSVAAGWPWLENFTWYDIRDDCPAGDDPDCRFGVLRENFSRKAAYRALSEVVAGKLPGLAPRLSLAVRRLRRGRYRARGTLFLPGLEAPSGSVRLRLARRVLRRWRFRTVSLQVTGGRFSRTLVLRPGSWRLRAYFDPQSRYLLGWSNGVSLRRR